MTVNFLFAWPLATAREGWTANQSSLLTFSQPERRKMQLLKSDGSVETLADIAMPHIEGGRLVCRDRQGNVIASFGHEVVAYGRSLSLTQTGTGDHRTSGRAHLSSYRAPTHRTPKSTSTA